MKLYSAYGANLNLAEMKFRCPDARPVKRLILQNWELGFSGVATIRPRPGSHVHGALWQLTKACEDSLDVFEGNPSLYRKIWLEQGGIEFMAYVMNRTDPRRPSQGYLDTITEGYRDWRLPVANLLATAHATKDTYRDRHKTNAHTRYNYNGYNSASGHNNVF